jgi:hemerythrin-like metal-binding protein
MPLITWNDNFSVQNKEMDEQHKYLINLINEFHDLMSTGKGRTVISETLDRMISYSQTHFSTEEKLMEKYHYSELEEQRNSHNVYKQKVLEFQKRYNEGQMSLTVEIMNYLKEWWTKHILEMDKKYSSFLK